jgi:hypothetical protein
MLRNFKEFTEHEVHRVAILSRCPRTVTHGGRTTAQCRLITLITESTKPQVSVTVQIDTTVDWGALLDGANHTAPDGSSLGVRIVRHPATIKYALVGAHRAELVRALDAHDYFMFLEDDIDFKYRDFALMLKAWGAMQVSAGQEAACRERDAEAKRRKAASTGLAVWRLHFACSAPTTVYH